MYKVYLPLIRPIVSSRVPKVDMSPANPQVLQHTIVSTVSEKQNTTPVEMDFDIQ